MTAGFKTENNTHFLATIEAIPPMGVKYNYVLKDHLGNTRIVFSDANNDGTVSNDEVMSEHHYYPFGMEMNGEWSTNRPQYNYTYNGKENQRELGLGYLNYGARFYDPSVGRWTSVDPAAEEYAPISPYAYVANMPIRTIDPDGRRIFFVGGAGNDQDGWKYIQRWGNSFRQSGISGFNRVNASSGKMGDVAFTSGYRNSGGYYYQDDFSSVMNEPASYRRNNHRSIKSAVDQVKSNLSANPLAEGEQLNLAGYSYGSVLQAQTALRLADEGTFVDNLILIGSPISDDSDLFKELSGNENIGNIIRVDIKGDLLSNPADALEFVQGAFQNSSDGGPHFDLARPGSDVNRAIQVVTDWLKKQGVD